MGRLRIHVLGVRLTLAGLGFSVPLRVFRWWACLLTLFRHLGLHYMHTSILQVDIGALL